MMKTLRWAPSCLVVFVIGVVAGVNGCKADYEEHDCDRIGGLYACKPSTGVWQYECQAGKTAANFWCQSIAGKPAVYMACDDLGDESGQTDETGDR